MKSVCFSATLAVPPPPHLAQAARVVGRVRVSPALAGVIAFHAFGPSRRSDLGMLASVTSARIADAIGVR